MSRQVQGCRFSDIMLVMVLALQHSSDVEQAQARPSKPVAARVSKRQKAKAGVLRSLQKISDDSNADLFSAQAAHAAFGNLRRA